MKITCCHSGRLLRTLSGHPRTPWTVKFHPTNKYIVASGCLGYQVRIWDWSLRMDTCLNIIRVKSAIISLAFHPSGDLLALASGNSLYLWDYDNQINKSNATEERGNEGANRRNQPLSSVDSVMGRRQERNRGHEEFSRGFKGRGTLVEMQHDHALRCVHFPPGGNTIIVGGVNSNGEGGIDGMTFSLNLWDFDISAFSRAISRRRIMRERGEGEALRNVSFDPEDRTFVPRILLITFVNDVPNYVF